MLEIILRTMCSNGWKVAHSTVDCKLTQPSQFAVEWEPELGSPFSRALTRWSKSLNFTVETIGAIYTLLLFA